MNTLAPAPSSARTLVRGFVILAGSLLLITLCFLASLFWVGSDLRALRTAALGDHANGAKFIEVYLGRSPCSLLSFASRYLGDLPPELRASLHSLRRVELSIFKTPQPHHVQSGLLARTDEAMTDRGWQRTVTVHHSGGIMAFYTPGKQTKYADVLALVSTEDQVVCLRVNAQLDHLAALAVQQIKSEHRAFF